VGRFLYFLVLFLLARLLWNAVSGLLTGEARRQMGARGRGDGAPQTIHKGMMVRDPVCGLHLPEHRAITEVRAGELYHFCSETCRQSFLEAS